MKNVTGNRRTAAARQRGLSLVELMIAMTLGLLIVGGMGALFVQNKSSYNQDEQVARMQEDGRYALNTLVDDIELTGFWANIFTPGSIDPHASLSSAGCSGSTPWIYEPDQPAVVFDHTGSGINTLFGCIANANHQANSDAIAINRVEGSPTTTALDAETIYLKSNGANGILLTTAMSDSTVSGTIDYWQYRPKVYYVRNYAVTAGDGIPTLCVYQLSEDLATPQMQESCIARGVESLQVEYGIDTDVDGVANTYTSTPSAASLLDRLVSVRVHLLMRSQSAVPGYTNSKTYSLGNLNNYQPNDGFYRRIYTTTILVRNTRNLRCIAVGC